MGPPKKRTPAGGLAGAQGCSREHPDTPNAANPQGPRLFVQVGRDIDGHKVTLHGYVGGYLTTIVRGLTEDEANERAESEANERGLAVRRD